MSCNVTRRHGTLLRLLCAVAAAACLHGQERRADAQSADGRSFASLTTGVRQAANANGIRELRLAWTAAPAPAGVARRQVHSFTIARQQRTTGSLRTDRLPALAADRLVVVSEDALGRELDWRIVPNPRIVRAESPGPGGALRGGIVEQDVAEFSVAVPDVLGLHRIRIYQPRWTGTEWVLDAIGDVLVP